VRLPLEELVDGRLPLASSTSPSVIEQVLGERESVGSATLPVRAA
jgi:hypothetical protein